MILWTLKKHLTRCFEPSVYFVVYFFALLGAWRFFWADISIVVVSDNTRVTGFACEMVLCG